MWKWRLNFIFSMHVFFFILIFLTVLLYFIVKYINFSANQTRILMKFLQIHRSFWFFHPKFYVFLCVKFFFLTFVHFLPNIFSNAVKRICNYYLSLYKWVVVEHTVDEKICKVIIFPLQICSKFIIIFSRGA